MEILNKKKKKHMRGKVSKRSVDQSVNRSHERRQVVPIHLTPCFSSSFPGVLALVLRTNSPSASQV